MPTPTLLTRSFGRSSSHPFLRIAPSTGATPLAGPNRQGSGVRVVRVAGRLPAVMGARSVGVMVRPPLPQAEYEAIYSRVPRLTVEVVVVSAQGVLLTLRTSGPCRGRWHLPGGTVRYGEHLTDAVHRVAADELGIEVVVDGLLGYIEYPSHLAQGIDWPVGIAFGVHLTEGVAARLAIVPGSVEWFAELPATMHDEQQTFLRGQGLGGGDGE